ncbi:S8 family peptidase [Fischerella sp. PCC 9605]|uniref:S8 family peptidase n=1 Tax=Fischerella sp. PCC 9605 TaxID=1173024 RepID=UPI001E3C0677|nr:S8 family peptidase [Fischerella sp. PCC 9605]
MAGSTSDLGKVFVDKYYDVDTSRSSHTPYNFSLGKASGTKYLGSEVDYVDVVNNKSYDFGKDAWELDYVPQNVTKYNSTTGYGLINAAAAVAKALGQSTFADVPNLGGNNWGADMVKAPEVWAKGYTGQGAIVAVVDTGVDYNHPDLSTNIWTNSKEIAGNGKDDDGNGYIDDVYGWNFDGNNNNSFDDNGHGTHVAGTIAGVKNSFGVTGIAYNAKIMSVKVMDSSGQGYYSAIANGVRYAVNNGARVINLSLGGSSSDSYLQSAVQYAASKGAIVVMAAGNNGGSVPDYPARYAENWGLAVGAVDKYNNLASFSNRAGTNPLAYVTAPGVNIYSTIPGNKYASYSGTSMATPHVAGVVALMLSANPNLTDSQVRQIITQISGTTTQSKVATTTYTANGDAATFRISASSFSSNNIATSSDTVISSTSSNSVDKNNLFENLHTWTDFGNDYKHSVVDTSYISISSEEYTEAENIVKNGKKPLETVYEIVG